MSSTTAATIAATQQLHCGTTQRNAPTSPPGTLNGRGRSGIVNRSRRNAEHSNKSEIEVKKTSYTTRSEKSNPQSASEKMPHVTVETHGTVARPATRVFANTRGMIGFGISAGTPPAIAHIARDVAAIEACHNSLHSAYACKLNIDATSRT